ncbi:MAG: DUF1311 domain-containing protein [Spirochaetaceae bacterium]|nr:MAG: DUF1311 domain-containing protein [Spirochaetaceae bacterium]
MQTTIFAIVWILCVLAPVTAGPALDPETFCIDMTGIDSAETQTEMNAAAAREYHRADDTLNIVYARIMGEYTANTEFVEAMRNAQRAWIVFRDLHLESIFPGGERGRFWGTIYPTSRYLELAEITWARVMTLYRWISTDTQGYHGSYGCKSAFVD